MKRLVLSCWLVALATVRADLQFTFQSADDVAVTAPGYAATGALDLQLGYTPAPGRNLTVVHNSGPAFISGTFDGVPHGAVVPLTHGGVTYRYIANYHGGNGRSLVLQWPELEIVGWGNDQSLEGSPTLGHGATPALLADPGGLAGQVVISTAPGAEHTLALTADGKIFAWGNNRHGQFGNGGTQTSDTPVEVDTTGALAGKTVVAISAGALHSLALTSDGRIFAWGYNLSGQLGDGTTENRLSPVAVSTTGALAGKSVVAISAGYTHSLALTSDGIVFAWGNGYYKQLGNGSTTDQLTAAPIDTTGVLAGRTVTGISAGFYHNLATTADGRIVAWGPNTAGELGNGGTTASAVPVLVNSGGILAGRTIAEVRAGAASSYALTADGRVAAWGGNGSGQLGNGTTTSSSLPVWAGGSISGIPVTALAVGNAHAVALTTDGQPHVWGSDGYEQLGNGLGPQTSRPSPQPVSGLGPAAGRRVAAIFAGANRSHALTAPGLPQIRVNPLDLTANEGATARFSAAASHPFPTTVRWQISPSGVAGPFEDIEDEPSASTATLAVENLATIADGAAFRAVFTSLSGSATSRPAVLRKTDWNATFSTAGPLTTVTAAAVGGNLEPALQFEPVPGTHLTLIQNVGPAPIAGRFANLPQGAIVPLTFRGVTYRYIVNYHGGNGRSLVLQWPATKLVGWGRSSSGVLGASESETLPVEIPAGDAMAGHALATISHSGGHVLALTAAGKVFAWGENGRGQLGDGTTTDRSAPVAIEGGALAGKTVAAVAAGSLHSMALTTEGRIIVWGEPRSATFPKPVSLLPVELGPGGPLAAEVVVAIAAGGTFDLALTAGGEIFGWGENSSFQLGSTNMQNRADPVRIPKGDIGSAVVSDIAAGDRHALALTAEGKVYAWGTDQYGALGVGNGAPGHQIPTPTRVGGPLAGKTVRAIAAASMRGMALTTDGEVFGWGINWNGELGTGGTANAVSPVPPDMSGVLAGKFLTGLACGSSHTAVLARDGSVFAWGDNGWGELGYPGWEDSWVPVAVSTPRMAGTLPTLVTAGWDTTLVLTGHGAPTVTRHPLGILTAAGQTVAFTAAAEDPYPFSVKWQVCPAGTDGPFTDIPGDTPTLTVPEVTAAQDGWAYRAVFTSAAGETASRAAVLRVTAWSATLAGPDEPPFRGQRIRASGTLDLELGFAPRPGQHLTLIRNDGPAFIDGAFDNLPQGGLITLTHGGNSHPFFINYFGGKNGRSLVLQCPWTTVAGWGSSLGNIPTAVTTRPELASETLVALEAGQNHQLALTATGRAFAWGSGGQGELGRGSTANSTAPVPVTTEGALAGKRLVAVAAGDAFSLALTADGRVFSWGLNTSGQLGDGTTTRRLTPVAVVDGALAGKTVTAIAAGSDHALALTAEGEVFAWGSNSFDRLGTEDWNNSPAPVAVDARGALRGKTVVAIAAGDYHSLALTTDGEMIAWGSNSNGKLGDGTTINPRVPVAVMWNGEAVEAIAVGSEHSAALTVDGRILTWGSNWYGQLGDGTTTSRSLPAPVALAGPQVAIAAGSNHTLSHAANGALSSWGAGTVGQLGDGVRENRSAPAAVSPGALEGTVVQEIASAGNRNFALSGTSGMPFLTEIPRDAALVLGAGASAPGVRFSAAALDPLPLAVRWQVSAAGGDFADIPGATSPALQLGGITPAQHGQQFRAVFSNAGGATATPPATLTVLAASEPLHFSSPATVPLTAASPVVAGELQMTLGFAPVPGAVLTVLRNSGGGRISGEFSNLPQGGEVVLAHGGRSHRFVADYYGGNGRSLVLRWAATLPAVWGLGISGQIGDGSTIDRRVSAAVDATGALAGEDLVAVSGGAKFSLGLTASGRIFAWGGNGNGELGNGSTTRSAVPVAVDTSGALAGKRIVAIDAGESHSLALSADGEVFSWGWNAHAMLGDGSTVSSAVPVAVSRAGVLAGRTVTAISAGRYHNVALTADGTLVAWGRNNSGELGIGSFTPTTVPVAVTQSGALAGKSVVGISAGGGHTLVLTADGRVYSWGLNNYGQLGTGGPSTNVPAALYGGGLVAGRPVVAIAAGANHSLALTADGKGYAWGYNSSGQLGTGGSTTYLPTAVHTTGVLAGKTLVAIAAGDEHSLALDSAGAGYAWGRGSSGQLGENSFRNSSSPVAMTTALGAIGSRPIMAIAAGGQHSLAIAARGTPPVLLSEPVAVVADAGSSVRFSAAADGYPVPTVRWQRSTTGPGGSFSNLTGTSAPELELADVGISQSGHAFRAVFTNADGSVTTAAATLTVRPTWAEFLRSQGLSPQTGALDDPFGTGVNLLLAYAFDIGPAAPDRAKLPAVTMENGRFRISYSRWKNVADLHYSVEASDGSGVWRAGPDVTQVISVTLLDNTRQLVVEEEIQPASSQFFRLRVVKDPP